MKVTLKTVFVLHVFFVIKRTVKCHKTRSDGLSDRAAPSEEQQSPSCRHRARNACNLMIYRRGAASSRTKPPHREKGSGLNRRGFAGSVPGVTGPLQPAQINRGGPLVSAASRLSPQAFRARAFGRTRMKTHPAEEPMCGAWTLKKRILFWAHV